MSASPSHAVAATSGGAVASAPASHEHGVAGAAPSAHAGAPPVLWQGAAGPAAPAAPAAQTLQADPLAELRGLHLPDAIGWWPLAPGWWLLFASAALVAIATAVTVRRRRRSLARKALDELARIPAAPATDLQTCAGAVATVLRRYALARFGRKRVAALHGSDWSTFLVATSSRRFGRGPALDARLGMVLVNAPYARPAARTGRDAASPDAAQMIAAARAWIRRNS